MGEYPKQVKIGPVEARAFLETMGAPSYPVRPEYVSLMAQRMKSGDWTLEGESLVVDALENMVSGRRRMHAVIEAGVEVEFVLLQEVGWPMFKKEPPSQLLFGVESFGYHIAWADSEGS